jgi:hypothetical protein
LIKFCRNCGEELTSNPDKACPHCGSNAVKATAYCRYCGKPTSLKDVVCPTCGSAIRPIAGSSRQITPENLRLVKLGKRINLTIVAILVAAYVIFSLPKAITKPIQAATAEVVMASTGYSALPLQYISSTPAIIPSIGIVGEVSMPSNFTPNSTRQLTIYAIYKNATDDNATKATRIEFVTDNCTFKSNNDDIVTVSDGGLVRAVSPGSANITVFYTAAPGSSNRTAAAEGKVPVTFNVTVPVTVGLRSLALFEAGYGR